MKPLSREEFKQALQKGLGRAYLHVRGYGIGEHQEVLLEVCLKSWVYDNQCVGGRGSWLFSILELTGKAQQYEREILANFSQVRDYSDLEQVLDLLKEFASRGSEVSRRTIYDWFDKNEWSDATIGGKQIIDIDGIEGFVHVAEKISARLKADNDYWETDTMLLLDYWETDTMLLLVQERFGNDEVEKALNERVGAQDNVAKYLKRLVLTEKGETRTREERAERMRQRLSLNKILVDAENCYGAHPGQYAMFGRYALEEELRVVFEKLSSEEREGQLLRLLWVFQNTGFPSLNAKVIKCANHDNDEISSACISALSKSSSPLVRSVADTFLESSCWEDAIKGIELLEKNLLVGDCQKIAALLKQVPNIIDGDIAHGIVMDILSVLDSNRAAAVELVPCLLWCYENSPCMKCREDAVRTLVVAGELPCDLLGECQFDANEEIRNLVVV